MSEMIQDVRDIRTQEVIASEIRTIVLQTQKTMLDGAVEIGRRLVEAKQLVSHGEWGSWLKEKVEFSQSAANRFMRLFEEYADKQGNIFGAVSNSSTLTNLSYTKALALLAIPEEDREDFAEDADAVNISVRELENKVKTYQEAKERADLRAEDLEEGILKLKEEKEALTAREENLTAIIDELKERSGSDEVEKIRQEMITEKNEILEEKAKSDEKADKLAKKLEQLRTDHQSILAREVEKASQEAADRIKHETEEEMQKLMVTADQATKAKLEAEKKLVASSSTDLIEFRFLVKELQENFSAAVGVLSAIEVKDAEMAANLHNGLESIMSKLIEQL